MMGGERQSRKKGDEQTRRKIELILTLPTHFCWELSRTTFRDVLRGKICFGSLQDCHIIRNMFISSLINPETIWEYRGRAGLFFKIKTFPCTVILPHFPKSKFRISNSYLISSHSAWFWTSASHLLTWTLTSFCCGCFPLAASHTMNLLLHRLLKVVPHWPCCGCRSQPTPACLGSPRLPAGTFLPRPFLPSQGRPWGHLP